MIDLSASRFKCGGSGGCCGCTGAGGFCATGYLSRGGCFSFVLLTI